MKRAAYTIAMLPVFFWAASPAQAEMCPQGPVEINITLNHTPAPENTSLSAKQIDRFFQNNRQTVQGADTGVYVGLTHGVFRGHAQMQFDARITYNTGAVCVAAKRVDYTITYKPVIYIASELLNIPCRYAMTRTHEQQHVAEFLKTINEYMPAIRHAMQQHFAQARPRPSTTQAGLEAAQQQIGAQLQAAIKPVIAAMKTRNEQRQMALDTPENYRRETSLCPGSPLPQLK